MRSELEQAWEETTRDALTGLGNRAAFDQQIERVVDVGFLFSERAYLFMIDLDHFKWVNDRCGSTAKISPSNSPSV
jgi:diguanylate cyclase (GGDEF)-like protein